MCLYYTKAVHKYLAQLSSPPKVSFGPPKVSVGTVEPLCTYVKNTHIAVLKALQHTICRHM